MADGHRAGAIRAYGQGLIAKPPLSIHYAANLERARKRWREERCAINLQGPAHTDVMVAAGELSHNAGGWAFTLAMFHWQQERQVTLLGSHFRPWGQALWEPIQGAVAAAGLPVQAYVVVDHSQFFWQAWELVLQHPADLVHLSKPGLPAVLFGLLYKLLWGAAVLMDIDDEELCFVGEQEPISVDALKREKGQLPPAEKLLGPLWTRLAMDLGQRFDGITVANTALQQRYGGTVIPHGRDPQQLRPITALKRSFARRRYDFPEDAKVVLFFGIGQRHMGLLEVAALPESHQRFERALDILALADLKVLLSSGEVAAFQSPAKLNDALAVGLPVLVSKAAPLQEAIARGWAVRAEPERLAEQLQQCLGDAEALEQQGARAREGFLGALALPVVADQLKPCVGTPEKGNRNLDPISAK